MTQSYDAIVIGARCGGSPTAMLLARKGYRVLMVDRATFPSDTVSTHFIHAPGMAALERWGLRDALAASGCPPIRTYSFDFGPFTIAGSPRAVDGIDEALLPATAGARHDVGPRGGRRRRRGARRVHRRRAPHRRRHGDRCAGQGSRRQHGDRARQGRHRRRRTQLVGGQGGTARAIQREARSRPGVLLVLERRRQLRLRGRDQRSLRHGRLPDPRRPHARHRRSPRGGVQRRPQRRRRHVPPNARPGPRTRRSRPIRNA